MKLILAIVHDEDASELTRICNQKGFMVTKMNSTGGFLRVGNTTLIIGVEDEEVEDVKRVFEKKCIRRSKTVCDDTPYTNMEGFVRRPIEVKVGGATIFILDVEQFLKI